MIVEITITEQPDDEHSPSLEILKSVVEFTEKINSIEPSSLFRVKFDSLEHENSFTFSRIINDDEIEIIKAPPQEEKKTSKSQPLSKY